MTNKEGLKMKPSNLGLPLSADVFAPRKV